MRSPVARRSRRRRDRPRDAPALQRDTLPVYRGDGGPSSGADCEDFVTAPCEKRRLTVRVPKQQHDALSNGGERNSLGEIRSGESCLIFAHSIPPRPLLTMRPLQISRKRMCWSCLLLLRLSGLNPSNAVVRKERFIVRPIDRGGRIVGWAILNFLAVDIEVN